MRLLAQVVCAVLACGLSAPTTHAETMAGAAITPGGAATRTLARLLVGERSALHRAPPAALRPAASKRQAKPDAPGTTPIPTDYDPAWLATLPPAQGGPQWHCLTQAVYFEGRGESLKGQFAIAEVVLNRVATPSYPDSICGVVRQGSNRASGCQFSFTCDGKSKAITEPAAWERAGKVARLMLDHGAASPLTAGATHFHTTNVSPHWARAYPRTARIGAHLFYRAPTAAPAADHPALTARLHLPAGRRPGPLQFGD